MSTPTTNPVAWHEASSYATAVRRHLDDLPPDVVEELAGGLEEVGDASVYGTLRRLYSAGALTSYVVPSEEGPHRKYYGINRQGQAMLDEQRISWKQFSQTMTQLLEPAEVRS